MELKELFIGGFILFVLVVTALIFGVYMGVYSLEPNYSCATNLYDCSDFKSSSDAQVVFDFCNSRGRGDIHNLDADSDSLACEILP